MPKFFKTELGREILSHVLWLLVWLMVVVLLRWKLAGLLPLAVGSLIGTALIDADRLLAKTSRSPFHNAGVVLVLGIMCFWILSSSVSWVGRGVAVGMFFHLLKDHLEGLLEGRGENVRETLFWPLQNRPSLGATKMFVVLMLLVFLGLSWMIIRGL